MGTPELDSSANGVPRPGDIIDGKYRVEETIGAGGMGVVVAGRHLTLRQRVAIKFMRPKHARDGDALTRFLREARAAALMKSEHATHIHDVGSTSEGVPFIVMELLEGKNLDAIVAERGRLPIGEAVDYVLQACDALAEAHAAGIVHRDLKPSNLFLAERPGAKPTLKVLDFGIAKSLVQDDDLPAVTSLTAPNTVLGSPQYMSPEQVRNAKSVDARSDVWSLGVIAYELLAGRPPFDADSLPHMYALIVSGEAVPLRTVRPEIPAPLAAAVMRCLEKEPSARTQDVAELARALKPHAAEGGRGAAARLELATTVSATSSPSRVAWVAAAALVAGAAFAVYLRANGDAVAPAPATSAGAPATSAASASPPAPMASAVTVLDAGPASSTFGAASARSASADAASSAAASSASASSAAASSAATASSARPPAVPSASAKVRDLKQIQLLE